MRKIKDSTIKSWWVKLELWRATNRCNTERCVLLSPSHPASPTQGHTEDEKPSSSTSQTGSLKCLSCLKGVRGGAGSIVAMRTREPLTRIIGGLRKAFHSFPPTLDLCPFVLTKEVEAPQHLQVCRPRSIAYSGRSAQSWRTSLLWTVRHVRDCAPCAKQQDASVRHGPYINK